MAQFGSIEVYLNDHYYISSSPGDAQFNWECTENDILRIHVSISTGQPEDSNYYILNDEDQILLSEGDTNIIVLPSYKKIEGYYWNTRHFTINLTVTPLPSKTLQISTSTPEANIYYTTDNSTPTSSSNLYTSTFTADIGTTIKAIGIKEGYIDSDIAEFTVS